MTKTLIKKLLVLALGLLMSHPTFSAAANLELSDVTITQGNVGGSISLTLNLNNSPNDIETFGLDITYDTNYLNYTGHFLGSLTNSWNDFNAGDYLDVNEPLLGTVRVGGFSVTKPISAGSSGSIVVLTFDVLKCQNTTANQGKLVDDFIEFSIDPGNITCLPTPIHVADIGMAVSKQGRRVTAMATVTVMDESSNPVSEVTVSGHWSGLTNDSNTAATDTAGRITLSSNPVKVRGFGIFTFTVDNLVKNGYVYDPSANVETSDSILSSGIQPTPTPTPGPTPTPTPTQCGNGVCESGENCNSCPSDCPQIVKGRHSACCGNGVCEKFEGSGSCPIDCL